MAILSSEKVSQALLGKMRWQVCGTTFKAFFNHALLFAPLPKDGALVERVFDSMIAHGNDRPSCVLVLVMEGYLNRMTFAYETRRRGLAPDRFHFTSAYHILTDDQLNAIWNEPYDMVVAYNIAYISEREKLLRRTILARNIGRLTRALADASEQYHVIDEFLVRDNKKIQLYTRLD